MVLSEATTRHKQNHTKVKLYAEEIGQRRLQELALAVGHGVSVSFNAKELGEYSIRKQPILVVLTGLTSNQQWVLMPCTRQNIEQHRGHCYLVRGRKVEAIKFKCFHGSIEHVMGAYEGMDRSTPLKYAKTGEIFRAGMGSRTCKKAKNKFSKEEAGTIGNCITIKRFKGSRLTCVCKMKQI